MNKILLGLAWIVLMTALSGCGESPPAKTNASIIRPVALHAVEDMTTRNIQVFPALVEASEESQLAFRVAGEVSAIHVVAGDVARKGELLAELDPTDFELEVDKRRADFILAQKTFQRIEKILSMNLISQAEFDEARNRLEVTKAALSTAKANLSYTDIRAPYNGVIASKKVESNETVAANQTVMSMHAEDGIDISFQLPESVLSKSSDDANSYQPSVEFTGAREKESHTYKASFKEMDYEPDPRSRTYKVVLTMPKPDGIFIVPGMTANVSIELNEIIEGLGGYVLVPIESVFSPPQDSLEEQTYAVWKLDPTNMTITQHAIEVAGILDDGIKVTKGLIAGDRIVAAGVHSLTNNTQVREWVKERGL